MKSSFILLAILTAFVYKIFPQANLIQSIDIDSQQRIIYGYTGPYDSSYVCRYKNGNLEKWNLTEEFNLIFYWISTAVDEQDNIWAYMQDKLYKYNGTSWHQFTIPSITSSYQKYYDLAVDIKYLWLSIQSGGVYGNKSVFRFNRKDSTWTFFNSENSNFPSWAISGPILLNGDSTYIGTNKGLVLIFNDSANVVLDTTNSTLGTQNFYSFYIDSKGNRWIGTPDVGLVKWIDNYTFLNYNTNNSNLPNNFVNAIDQDSKGNIWLATDYGFACLQGDSIISYSYLTNNSIITLKVDNQDRIWIGDCCSGNLMVFDGVNLNVITDVKDEKNPAVLNSYHLSQNYPNPFNTD